MRTLLALLVVLLSLPLAADFKCTITGNVQAPDGKPGGIAVSIQADNLWGRTAETFEKFKQDNGPLPKITLDVTATTDKFGAFSIECDVKVGPEGKLPVRRERQGRNGPEVETPYVYVIVKPTKAGFRGDARSFYVSPNGKHNAGVIGVSELASLSGTVIRLSDRKPQPDLKLRLRFTARAGITPELLVTTDAAGKFKLDGESVPQGQANLSVDDANWAFAGSSVAWQPFHIKAGANDLGTLIVVPGGSIKGKLVDADTKAGVACNLSLRSSEQGSRIAMNIPVTDGTFEAKGLPEGSYELQVGTQSYWQLSKFVFKITGGKVAEMGDLALEPHRKLEVLAFTDTGAGLEKYMVTLTWAGGDAPVSYQNQMKPGVGQFKRQELTAEKCTLEGLWSSKWTLQVQVAGHAPATVEVEIPKQTSVKVTLERGGAIRVNVQNEQGVMLRNRQVFAVSQASPAYKEAKAGTLKVDNWGEPPAGVYRGTDMRRGDETGSLIDAIAAGTYFVWAFTDTYDRVTNQPVRVVQDNVVVEKGQTVDITLKPTPGRLTVNVTESGSPKAGVKVYLTQLDWNGVKLIKEATSDATGAAVMTDLQPVAAVVLSKREYDWVVSLGRDAMMTGRDRMTSLFKARNVVLGFGADATVALEINDPSSIWVTLEVKVTGGGKPDRGNVFSTEGDANRPWERVSLMCTFTDGKANLGPMSKGKYRFTGSATISGEGVSLDREFEVTTPPEQTVKLDFTFESLVISVKLPKNVPAHAVRVSLAPVRDPDAPFNPRDDWSGGMRHRSATPDEKGTITFVNVAAGKWTLTGHATVNGVLCYAVTEDITVKGDTKVSLKFNENVGSINVRISGNPAMGPNARGFSTAKVFILDSKDKHAEVGDPNFLVGMTSQTWTIPSVPAGTWNVVVAAHGLQPVTQKLKVEKDKAATLNVSPLPAAVAQFILTAEDGSTRNIERFELTYEDADGKPVVMWTPDKNWMTGGFTDGGKLQVIGLNIHDKVKKVRVTIAGYEDVTLDITFEAGKTFLSEQTLKKKP